MSYGRVRTRTRARACGRGSVQTHDGDARPLPAKRVRKQCDSPWCEIVK